jgi:hypothetical protein
MACGLFPDVSELTHSSDAGGDDVVQSDAAKTDAGADSAIVDGASGDGASPCSSQHVFCDDFDDGGLGATWDDKYETVGPLSLSTAFAVSQPRSLFASAPGTASGDESALGKKLPVANHTHVELDVYVTSPTNVTNTEVDLVDLILTPLPLGTAQANFNLQRYEFTSQIEQYVLLSDGGSPGDIVPFNESFSSWRHVTLDVDFVGQKFSATVDGKSVASISMNPQIAKTGLELYTGIGYIEVAHGAWGVYVDNVVVDQN